MIYFNRRNYPESVKLHCVLTDSYGIGIKKAEYLCWKSGYLSNVTIGKVKKDVLRRLEDLFLTTYGFSNLRRRMFERCVKELITKGVYRGRRLAIGLPARGQRTHTNASTSRKLRLKTKI